MLPRMLLLRQSQAVHRSCSGGGPCPAPSQGRGQGLAEAAQPGWDSPGSGPAAAPHLSAPKGHLALHVSRPQPAPCRPPRSCPCLLHRRPARGGLAGTPRCPVPQACTSIALFPHAMPGWGWGNRKPQSSCSQLLRHIWIATCALLLLLLLLLLFTLCRHVGS